MHIIILEFETFKSQRVPNLTRVERVGQIQQSCRNLAKYFKMSSIRRST